MLQGPLDLVVASVVGVQQFTKHVIQMSQRGLEATAVEFVLFRRFAGSEAFFLLGFVDERIVDLHLVLVAKASHDSVSLFYWFPITLSAGIPQPREFVN